MDKKKQPKIDYVRPEVREKLAIWTLIDDCIKGEEAIKAKGTTYLPKPVCSEDDILVNKNYESYKARAVFYNATGRTHKGLVGQVFAKPSKDEVPTALEPLLSNVDGGGMSLDQQAKRSVSACISKGRAGLLSDYPTLDEERQYTKAELGDIKPRIIYYPPTNIINWREAMVNGEIILSLVVLTEKYTKSDDGFEQETEDQWRVLRIDPETNYVLVEVYRKDTEKSGQFTLASSNYLRSYKQKWFTRIPFTFIGSENNDSEVDDAPLKDIAQLNVAHYRNSADYEESSYLCGQPTPVFSGLTEQWVEKYMKGKVILGSKSAVSLPVGAKADMLQADPNNLPGEAMKKKEDQMKSLGAKLIEPKTVQRTATEVKVEEESEASVLSTIAKNVSAAYRKALFYCSWFIGEVSEDEIKYELNDDFSANKMSSEERKTLVGEWQSGAISFEEMRVQFLKSGIAITEDHEEAKQLIEAGFEDHVEDSV